MIPLKQNDTLIIIPVFNEEKNIGNVVDSLIKNYKAVDILVIDDGSYDHTAEILNSKNIFVLNHVFNMGIGATFQTGCQFALSHNYKYIIRMDGDGQHDPAYIKDFLSSITANQTDIVIGSRFLGNSSFKSSFYRIIGILIISFILKMITKKKITDPTSGFCAMNRKAYEFFSVNCVDDYPEPEILLYHKKFRIKEIPITMGKRNFGSSSITPLKSLYYMFKVLFSLLVSLFRKREEG